MNGAGNDEMLRARGLRKDYGNGGGLVRAVDEVDLDVAAGETLAVMGPSGCGKSTLLHLLGGLDRPTAGEIWLAGKSLGRLEKAELAACELAAGGADRADRKVYALTAQGHRRVSEWLGELSWPKPDLAEFHLKLLAAAASGLADPVAIVDAQRRELLRRLREAQRAAMAEPDRSDAGLLLEGIVLRLQADLRWLEACERRWAGRAKARDGATGHAVRDGQRP